MSEPSVRIARGATYLALQGIITNLGGVVYFAFAARLLPSVADFGRVSTLSMLMVLFMTLGNLGLPSAVVKFISYAGSDMLDDVNGVFRLTLRVGIALSLLSSIVCFFGSQTLASHLLGGEEYTPLIVLLSVDVFPAILLVFLLASLQGLQRFGEMAMIGVVNAVLKYGVAILGLISFGLVGVVLGWVIGDVTSTVLALLLTLREFRGKSSPQFLGPMLRYSAPLYVSNALTYAVGYVDRYLILLLAGQAVLGIYSPAVTASALLGVVSGAIGSALLPLLSQKHGNLGEGALKQITDLSSRYVFLIYVPLAFGMAATAYPTMAFFVGESFLEGAVPLAILSLASALTCGTVVVNNVLLAISRTSIFFVVSLLSIVADVAISFLLIGPLGPIGAAIARTSTIFISFAIPALFLDRLLGYHLDVAAFIKSTVASSVMALAVLLCQLIWLSKNLLPLYVILGGVVYITMLRYLRALGEDDIAMIRRFVPARMHPLVALAQRFLV